MLMPQGTDASWEVFTPFPLLLHRGTREEVVIGHVEVVEVVGRDILAHGRLNRGYGPDWYAIEMYLGREFIVPVLDCLDVETRSDQRQIVWKWKIIGFEVLRFPPWDLPAPRVQQDKPPW
jgi:hypothetical protein